MKIGLNTRSYSDIVYFEVDENSLEGRIFISNLITFANIGGDSEVDLIIQPNKKETKITTNEEA